ncbi:hypothetical protein MMC07_006468 [Pseudocyphellaria aurata]|nr:hypothetical protein [Pseudocyphellaria aurata]
MSQAADTSGLCGVDAFFVEFEVPPLGLEKSIPLDPKAKKDEETEAHMAPVDQTGKMAITTALNGNRACSPYWTIRISRDSKMLYEGKQVRSNATLHGSHKTGYHNATDLSKQKVTDKLAQMMRQYKDWKAKLDATGWGLNVDNHENTYADDIGVPAVKALTLQKCFLYYEFDKLLGHNVAIMPSLTMESGRPNRVNMEIEEETENDNETNFLSLGILKIQAGPYRLGEFDLTSYIEFLRATTTNAMKPSPGVIRSRNAIEQEK